MMKITALTAHGTGGKNSAPIMQYLKSTEYLLNSKNEMVSSARWFGRGAEALDLIGKPVEAGVMDSLARGFSPDGRTAMCKNAGARAKWVEAKDDQGVPLLDKHGKPRGHWEGGHRVGWEFNFSSDKGPSILYADAAPAEREQILRAHTSAVESTLEWIQSRMETRRGKGGRDVIAADIVASLHTHQASREQETGTWDPQLHTHVLVYNLGRGADGAWSTLSPEQAYNDQMTAGAMYRAAFARNMQSLGYGIEKRPELDAEGQETGRIYWSVSGVKDELCKRFSKRRAAIEEYMQEHGTSAQQACMATRTRKNEPEAAELIASWHQTFATMRRDEPDLMMGLDKLKNRPDRLGEIVDDAKILTALQEREAVWTRTRVMERIALEHLGREGYGTAQEIEQRAAEFIARNELVPVAAMAIHHDDRGDKLALRHREDRYTTRAMIEIEQQIMQRAQDRHLDSSVHIAPERVAAAVNAFEAERGCKLSSEQRSAVDWVCSKSGGTTIVVGRAGTGKTMTAQAWTNAMQADGKQVIGVAVGWNAARKLESETGIVSYSARSLLGQLDRGKIVLNPGAVVVLDEAGMAGSQIVHRLQQWTDSAQGKLILQGDPIQLQPIDAGAPMRLAMGVVGAAELKDIRRQRSHSDRATADEFYARDGSLRSRADSQAFGAAVVARLAAAKQLAAYATDAEARDALVDDHLNSPLPARDKLILGSTRADVDALNLAVRAGMRARGTLGPDELTITARDRGSVRELALAIGERVRFTKRDQATGVVNGDEGAIASIHRGRDGAVRIAVRIESEDQKQDGRLVLIDGTRPAHLGYAYASTVHKAQGQGRAEVRQLGSVGMTDRHLALVGFTRTKSSYRLYGADNAMDQAMMAVRYGTDRLKESAAEQSARRPRQAVEATSLRQRAAGQWRALVARVKRIAIEPTKLRQSMKI